jgi:uncharacterized membrane protein
MGMHDMHQGMDSSHNETPLEILKRRFALGEITREQYDEMRTVLLDEASSHHH